METALPAPDASLIHSSPLESGRASDRCLGILTRNETLAEPTAHVPDELLERLRPVANATIVTLLLNRGYEKVYVDGVRTMAPGRRLVGRAVTLKYLPSRPDLAERIATGSHGTGFNETPRWAALEALGPGDAFVVDAMRLGHVSTGGDVVWSRIVTKGAAGVVTDGAVRDGRKVIRHGFPVFAAKSVPTTSEPNILPFAVNEPISCGGVLVWPGDVILGDDDGVVVLPSQLAAPLIDEAVRHDEMERALLEYTQREKISPSQFYPFNENTERIYRQWKEEQR